MSNHEHCSRTRVQFGRFWNTPMEHDYYVAGNDKELTELLEEWNKRIRSEEREGAHPRGSGSRSSSHPSNSSLDESTTASTGTVFCRHRRYADHTMAYRHTNEPYDSAQEAQRAAAFLSQQKMLGKPFEAAGRGNSSKPSRVLLGDCVKELYQAISDDWVEADPVMLTTAEDLIVVYFRVEKHHHRDVLRRYMSGCLLRNLTCRQYDLRKVPEGWNKETDDGYIMFTFRPMWVNPQRFLPKASRKKS